MMSLWVLIPGTMLLLWLSVFLVIGVFFTAGGGPGPGARTSNALENYTTLASIIVLPATCFVSIGMLWYDYVQQYTRECYWWFALPAPFAMIYWLLAKYYSVDKKLNG